MIASITPRLRGWFMAPYYSLVGAYIKARNMLTSFNDDKNLAIYTVNLTTFYQPYKRALFGRSLIDNNRY